MSEVLMRNFVSQHSAQLVSVCHPQQPVSHKELASTSIASINFGLVNDTDSHLIA
jgi:hypothetical protein